MPAPDTGTQDQDTPPTHLFAPGDAPPAVPGFEVGDKLGEGGMGAVYAARDLTLDREVAVKVMLPGRSAAEFERESKVMGRLPHPGIPPVHAFGRLADGRPYLAMKVIRGRTLKAILADRPDPSSDRGPLVAAFEQVCQAVGYAHRQGLVHRDLKPDNLMVGAFGEVQVMDWGLAKAVGDATEAAAAAPGGAFFSENVAATVAGQVKGTPAYMAPEQARGEPVDARADVFALGGILSAILTGHPPFAGTGGRDTTIRAARAELDETFKRLAGCGADEELIGLAKWCLSAVAADRPADGAAVAAAVAAVAAYRAGVDARLRRAEQDQAAAEAKASEERNTRREAEARADAERAKAEEQRKRRRVQLILAGVVAVVLAGAGIASSLIIERQADDRRAADRRVSDERLAAEKKQAEDRLAAEKKLADERLEAEQKRQNDLRDADRQAAARQRKTRADARVQMLAGADSGAVKQLVADLAEFRDLTGPALRELAARPPDEKPGLHARLALLADEPDRAKELVAYLPGCRPDELLPLREALKPHAAAVVDDLWAVVQNLKADPGRRARSAGALAGLAPDDRRWAGATADVAAVALTGSPAEFVVVQTALDPVGGRLAPEFLKRYPESRRTIEAGKLAVPDLVAVSTAYDRTAVLLARYATRPGELAELALLADPRHYELFARTLRERKAEVVPLLLAVLEAKRPEKLAVDKLDAALEAHGKRRGYAAAALLALGEAEPVWPLFVFPKDGDPTARSYLQERLRAVSVDPSALVRRFDAESDVSAKRALVVGLGEFPPDAIPADVRQPFVARLLALYRDDPDAGLHGAIDWLLRQKWEHAKEVVSVDEELAAAARGRVLGRVLLGAGQPLGTVMGPQLPAPPVPVGKDWFVNGEGQTYTVVRGPVTFRIGSPPSEPVRSDDEVAHEKRIGRSFAIATKAVTMAEYQRLRAGYEKGNRYSPGPDTPAIGLSWYMAAEYCNFLSEREGIPPDQWCYERNAKGQYAAGMAMKKGHLGLTGYRLPTEAEWEYVARSGAVTARYYGRGEELLPRFGRFLKTSDDHTWPVGQLRPNERGLFDMLGNVFQWCENPYSRYDPDETEDEKNSRFAIIDEQTLRLLRGGSFGDSPVLLRSANRNVNRPGLRYLALGFRPARTLLD
jgi:formylglycine-generating enzyme required for sulfatase activity